VAAYSDLFDLARNEGLKDKVRVAIIVASDTIMNESGGTANHTERVAWAKAAMASLEQESTRVLWMVLAANKALSQAAIESATDAAIQTNVDAVVDFFAV